MWHSFNVRSIHWANCTRCLCVLKKFSISKKRVSSSYAAPCYFVNRCCGILFFSSSLFLLLDSRTLNNALFIWDVILSLYRRFTTFTVVVMSFKFLFFFSAFSLAHCINMYDHCIISFENIICNKLFLYFSLALCFFFLFHLRLHLHHHLFSLLPILEYHFASVLLMLSTISVAVGGVYRMGFRHAFPSSAAWWTVGRLSFGSASCFCHWLAISSTTK